MTYRDFGTCTECGEEAELWLIRDDVRLCDDWTEEGNWIQCSRCGDVYVDGEVEFTELPEGRSVCEYCMEDYPWDEEMWLS